MIIMGKEFNLMEKLFKVAEVVIQAEVVVVTPVAIR